MNSKIKVAIVEDVVDIRNDYCFLINQSEKFECTGFASSEEALPLFQTEKFDIVLMDVNLPGMNGIECTRLIKEKYPETLILMFTVYENNENVFKALQAGANGYLLKQSTPDELLKAIEEVHSGGAPMSASIARMVVSSFSKKSESSNEIQRLSDRERDVLSKLSEGYRYKDIADLLFISVSTVRSHIYNIYEKLHVHNRTEALNKFNRK